MKRAAVIGQRPLILGLAGIALLGGAWFHLRPAFTSEASIRTSLLAQVPVGSSLDDVYALAKKQGWIDPVARLDSYMVFSAGSTETMVTAYGGRLRHDPFPYRTEVGATWQFDQSNRLFDIHVDRYGYE